jgi:hypothetical protein
VSALTIAGIALMMSAAVTWTVPVAMRARVGMNGCSPCGLGDGGIGGKSRSKAAGGLVANGRLGFAVTANPAFNAVTITVSFGGSDANCAENWLRIRSAGSGYQGASTRSKRERCPFNASEHDQHFAQRAAERATAVDE